MEGPYCVRTSLKRMPYGPSCTQNLAICLPRIQAIAYLSDPVFPATDTNDHDCKKKKNTEKGCSTSASSQPPAHRRSNCQNPKPHTPDSWHELTRHFSRWPIQDTTSPPPLQSPGPGSHSPEVHSRMSGAAITPTDLAEEKNASPRLSRQAPSLRATFSSSR